MVENGLGWCEDRLGWRLLKELSLILYIRIPNKTFITGIMGEQGGIRK